MTPFAGRPVEDEELAGQPLDGDIEPNLSDPLFRFLFQRIGTPIRAYNFLIILRSDDSSGLIGPIVAEFGDDLDVSVNGPGGTGIGGGGGDGYVEAGVIGARPSGQTLIVGEVLTDAYIRLQSTSDTPPASVNPLTEANYPGYFADRNSAWDTPELETKFLLIAQRIQAPPPNFEVFFTPPTLPAYDAMNGEADLVFDDYVSFAATQPTIFNVQRGGIPSITFIRTFFGLP